MNNVNEDKVQFLYNEVTAKSHQVSSALNIQLNIMKLRSPCRLETIMLSPCAIY